MGEIGKKRNRDGCQWRLHAEDQWKDPGDHWKYDRHGSLAGAILMSNIVTKKEALERKLFGVPPSAAGFIKRIKAGTLLFFFEFEERKLYGVFESTSDGAMNIIPNAFTSTGNYLPAQIHFKRIWMCQPLSEAEFCHAIEENYYHRNKFNFNLSYDQVVKLVQLFNVKRINLTMHCQPGIPNEIIREFEDRVMSKSRFYGRGLTTLNDARMNRMNDGSKSCRGWRKHWNYVNNPYANGRFSKNRVYIRQAHHFLHGCQGSKSSGHRLLPPPPNCMRSACRDCCCPGTSFPLGSSDDQLHCHGYNDRYDPSHNRTDCLPATQLCNSHSSHVEEPRWIQPCACVGPPRYIPSQVNQCFDENAESSQFVSEGKDAASDYSSETTRDDDSEEYYPSDMKPRLRSDTEGKRTSAFSRLTVPETSQSSKDPCHLPRNRKTPEKKEGEDSVTDISIDQLKRILTQRKEQYDQNTKTNGDSALRKDTLASNASATPCGEILFLDCEGSKVNEMNAYAGSDPTEESPQNYKRRKLMFRSASEEHKNVQGSTEELVGEKNTDENNENNVLNAGSFIRIEDVGANMKTIPTSGATFGDITPDKSVKTTEGYMTYGLDAERKNISVTDKVESPQSMAKKEIVNRNLRWFLQKFDGGAMMRSNGQQETREDDASPVARECFSNTTH